MPSPFPGMDPYLEVPALWSDLHLTLIVAMRAELNASLPDGYLAAADRHVWVEESGNGPRHLLGKPDVFVAHDEDAQAAPSLEMSSGTAVAPRTVTLPVRRGVGKPFLKIIDAQERRVVTVIELLSPSNKSSGDDRKAYLSKRQECLALGVNFVEINLLRGGKSPPLGKPRLAKGRYYLLVSRAKESPQAAVWSFGVRDPLPTPGVPLRGDESVALNLKKCLDRAYDEARYGREIDYTHPPRPPLDDADAAWAEALLRAAFPPSP